MLGVVLNKVRPGKDKRAYYRAEAEQTGRAARAAGNLDQNSLRIFEKMNLR